MLISSLFSAAAYLFFPLFTGGWKKSFLIMPENIQDMLYIVSLASHLLWAALIAVTRKRRESFALKMPAGMFTAALLLFLFSFLYACNAGLEYIQRYAQSSDILSFAPDTAKGKAYACCLYIPFLVADFSAAFILKKERGVPGSLKRMALALLSAALYSLSFPSLFHVDGFPVLAFLSLVPLLALIESSTTGEGIFWAVVSGVFRTTIINYWLSTFSLVSLQAVILIYLVHYLMFMTITVIIHKNTGRFRWLLFPLSWVVLEYFRTKGFAAYPWCPLGSSQYKFTELLQIASVTGVYGISFIIAFFNSSAARTVLFLAGRKKSGLLKAPAGHLASAALLILLAALWGKNEMARLEGEEPRDTVKISLIQQNTDPRKTDYRKTFDILKNLTDSALADAGGKSDLVAWSETAYIPNIRRWGSLPPESHSLAGLTHEFLEYQKKKGVYLLTGNDDYELVGDGTGAIERKSYNAAVLLTDTGKRADTYRKIKLVPFTEYFPFREQLPRLYDLLLKMDVNLWEPGSLQTVFQHPRFAFSSPICFEDIFPDYVRGFTLSGADLILNISNDYWSLTESEGKQHFITGMIRAVENRRPVARATASGLTGLVERTGKIRDTLPFYRPLYVNAEISLYGSLDFSFYVKHGDWFPLLCTGIVILILAGSLLLFLFRPRKKKEMVKIV